MKATKSDLRALLQRVQSADGPDDQLNRDLAIDLRDWSDYIQTPTRDVHEKMLGYKGTASAPALVFAMWPELVTSSIDAAFALVEQQLPGRGYRLYKTSSPKKAHAWWFVIYGLNAPKMKRRPTAPLAILAALLSALINQDSAR